MSQTTHWLHDHFSITNDVVFLSKKNIQHLSILTNQYIQTFSDEKLICIYIFVEVYLQFYFLTISNELLRHVFPFLLNS